MIPPVKSNALIFFLALVLVELLAFHKSLIDLARFAQGSQLFSHIPLIPAVTMYLLFINRASLGQPSPASPRLLPAAGLALCGVCLLVLRAHMLGSGYVLAAQDNLAFLTASFLFFLAAAVALCFGLVRLRALAFPIGFLIFMVPFPVVITDAIMAFLQQGSALTSEAMLFLAGMPHTREGTLFKLPGFWMEVAPECSGIHSTLALFITSILASYLLLHAQVSRWMLTLSVLPLALLRNGLRIFTIGQLCVQCDPAFIESPIHRRGGPIFFVFSLVPLFALLLFLRWREGQGRTQSKV